MSEINKQIFDGAMGAKVFSKVKGGFRTWQMGK